MSFSLNIEKQQMGVSLSEIFGSNKDIKRGNSSFQQNVAPDLNNHPMLNKKYYWDAHNYFKMKYLIRVIERKKLDEFLLLELTLPGARQRSSPVVHLPILPGHPPTKRLELLQTKDDVKNPQILKRAIKEKKGNIKPNKKL